jgi:enoyl-CoA hydratase
VVPTARWAALRDALTRLRPNAASAEIERLIDQYATGEHAGPAAAMHAEIDRWFAHDRIEDILAGLQRDGSELARATCRILNEKSPRGMVVTLKLLRLARASSSLEQCLVREYRAALQVFASDDFREGVRAAVIDKDRNPHWSPPRIEDVTPEMVAPYFAEIGADELVFGQST